MLPKSLYWKTIFKLSHHLVKFGDHRHRGSEDLMLLVCHEISQDHIIKGSYVIS